MFAKMNTPLKNIIRFSVFGFSFLLIGHLIMSDVLSESLSSLISGNRSIALEIMDFSVIILFLVGLCGMLFFIFNFPRFVFRKFLLGKNPEDPLIGMPYKSILFFIVPGMLVFVISGVFIIQVREQIINFLGGLDDRSVVRINDTLIGNRPTASTAHRSTPASV